MIIIALPGKAGKMKKILTGNAKWCYVGKSIGKREKISGVLGEENRFYLKNRLHEISQDMREPYIEFVAHLGKEQVDQLNWWASKFASKNHFQTDFFLLSCYKRLIKKLVAQNHENDKLIIFVEDPWLFADIKRESHGDKEIRFFGRPNTSLIKIFLGLRGIICRMLMVTWIFVARLLVLYYCGCKKPGSLKRNGKALGIINPAEPMTFKDGRYTNNYMPGLPELYEKNKIPFFYIYLLRFPLSTLANIRKNKELLWPLILDVRFLNVAKRVFQYWNPILAAANAETLSGYNIFTLMERERWLEFSSAGFNVHLILFDTLNGFFKKRWCESVTYVFENQPWEKMLCLAANQNNIKTVGYQHSVISRPYLSQFIGKTESLFTPLPHKLITSGRHSARLYKEGGMPEDKIAVGGAWRYMYAVSAEWCGAFTKKTFSAKPVILVLLSRNITMAKSTFEGIFRAITDNNLADEMEFWVKPHPANTRYELKKLNRLISGYRVVDKPLGTLLKDLDVVIGTASICGLEAFLCGKKAILYIPENLLAADPLMDIDNEKVYKWYEGESIDVNFLKNLCARPDESINTLRSHYFGEINNEIWLKDVSI